MCLKPGLTADVFCQKGSLLLPSASTPSSQETSQRTGKGHLLQLKPADQLFPVAVALVLCLEGLGSRVATSPIVLHTSNNW